MFQQRVRICLKKLPRCSFKSIKPSTNLHILAVIASPTPLQKFTP
jgi:hypothetical protein